MGIRYGRERREATEVPREEEGLRCRCWVSDLCSSELGRRRGKSHKLECWEVLSREVGKLKIEMIGLLPPTMEVRGKVRIGHRIKESAGEHFRGGMGEKE